MATSLIVPLAYITVLITSLAIFSRVYRRRRLAAKTSFEPWFPTHPTRDIYITLLSAPSSSTNPSDPDPTPTSIPDSLLKAALLNRATTDVKRIWRIRDDKTALTQLHAKGLIGDETMDRFNAAEKELEAEIVDVVGEANSFRMGWGQGIFGTATEMAHAERGREVVLTIPRVKAAEDKRIALRKKYLPEQSAPAITAASTPAIKSTPPATSTPQIAAPQKVPAGGGSPPLGGDEEVVGEPSKVSSSPASGASTPSKTTSKNKKKGKK